MTSPKPSGRFSIRAKIFLIAFSFSLPIGVLVYLMVDSINANITVARMEQKGNAYMRPLEHILERIGDDWIAAETCAPDPDACSARRKDASTGVTRAIEELARADAEYGKDLLFTGPELAKRGRQHVTVANVSREWAELAASKTPGREQYGHLAGDVRTMIVHAGDTSNLILDPDLDTYYLMDATLIALPETQDRMAQAGLDVARLLARGKSTAEERIPVAVSAALLEQDRARVMASSQTSLNEDSNFYGTSPTLERNLVPAMRAYDAAASRLVALTRSVADPASHITPEEYLSAVEGARKTAFSYWNVAVDELDRLLEFRAAHYRQARARSLFLSALALLVAGLFAFALMRTIIGPLGALIRNLGPGATLLSESVKRMSEVSRSQNMDQAEAAIICGELDAHAQDMRYAVLELARQVSGAGANEVMARATNELVEAGS